MERLRILQAVYCLGRGGAERLSIDITNELNKRENIEALLISFNKTADYEYSTKNVNYRYCPSEVKLSIIGKNNYTLNNYTKLIEEFKPNIVHSHRYLSEVVTREIIFPEIAYFTHLHNNVEQFQKFSIKSLFDKEKLINYYEKKRMLKRYYKCQNNFIAISQDSYDYALKSLPKSLHNIKLLNNAINFKKFNAYSHKRIINKHEEIRLISIGKLSDNKNHIFFINVIKILKDKGYNIVLDILGAGSNYQMLNNNIISENLENNIILRGNVDNVEEFLCNSHTYVHSSLHEAFGLVLIEAMATGLPCVALDAGGNRDIINNGENGYIVFDLSPVTFADKIIELIEQKETYDKIVENSLITAKEHDISKYVDKLLDYYYQVLSFKC